jgi:protein AbiQ
MDFYHVSDSYINFLKGIDSRVCHNKSDQNQKPYIGVVMKIGEIDYLAPLTSHKEQQNYLSKDNPTVFKLHGVGDEDDKLGMIQINNMIPIIESEINKIDFSLEEEKYRFLLQKQYKFILSKQAKIQKRAKVLHDAIVEKKEPIYPQFHVRCCDFALLEAKYLDFKTSP